MRNWPRPVDAALRPVLDLFQQSRCLRLTGSYRIGLATEARRSRVAAMALAPSAT